MTGSHWAYEPGLIPNLQDLAAYFRAQLEKERADGSGQHAEMLEHCMNAALDDLLKYGVGSSNGAAP